MKELKCVVNCAKINKAIAAYRKPIILMAKANCYGLGLEVARAVQDAVVAFGVAFGEEGVALRRLCDKPILITTPWWTLSDVLRCRLSPMIQSVEDARRIGQATQSCGVQIKLNSGMNRFGISSVAELRQVLAVLRANPNIYIAGAYTHYASASRYEEQNKRLSPMLAALPKGICVHTQATSTADRAGFDALRVGLGAYRDSVRLYSRVIATHRVHRGEQVGYDGIYTAQGSEYLAVMIGGYADGLAKALVGHLVSIKGRYYPIVAVCMDVCILRVSPMVNVGDEVAVLGETPLPKGLTLYETYTGLHGRCRFEYEYTTEI